LKEVFFCKAGGEEPNVTAVQNGVHPTKWNTYDYDGAFWGNGMNESAPSKYQQHPTSSYTHTFFVYPPTIIPNKKSNS
jgi:hypothetical protein